MAGRLSFRWRILLALALGALMGCAYGQTLLPDPTRPPVGASEPGASGLVEGESAGLVLQSVKIPSKGKPVAVIGGQEVKLGESIGELRLIRLTEREAVLQGPDGVEHLSLTPGIEKTMITQKSPQSSKSPTAKRAQPGGKP